MTRNNNEENRKAQVMELLNTVENPLTHNSLITENRIKDIEIISDHLKITYSRDGLGASEKRQIETKILESLKTIYDEDAITLFTVSQHSGDTYRAENQKPPAQLKTGHGGAGGSIGPQKKRVLGANKVIAVSSCKGGVGKSTVAVNLALALKKQGKKIGLLDADIYGPSLPTLLGQQKAQPLATPDKKIIPIEAFGLKFMSFGLFAPETEPVIWRGPMLGGVLNQFLFDVDWGALDYLIIDLPPGTGDMQLSMVQTTEVDGAVIVSTPGQVALLDTVKGLKMFRKVNVPILGMVENMSFFVPPDHPDGNDKHYYIFGKDGVKNTARELELPFLGEIPIEIELREGGDKGLPYMEQSEYEGRLVWDSYMNLAKKIHIQCHGVAEGIPEKKSFLSKIFK